MIMTHKLYSVLGLNKDNNPSQHDIKKAFRKLAMEYHPDKNKDNPDAESKFKEISHAYEVLSDESKKRNYDHCGDKKYNESGGDDHPFSGMNHADIFEQFFGGASPFGGSPFDGPFGGSSPFGHHFGFNFREQNGKETCENVHKEFSVTLEDVFNGVNKNIMIHITKYCQNCMATCKNCNGSGMVKQVKHMGVFTQIFTGKCEECQGSGHTCNANKSCSECQGKGTYTKNVNASLILPKGIESGFKTVFEGMGDQPKNKKQKAGDLILQVNVSEHKTFKRNGNDLIYKCDISYVDSVVGKEITIPYFKEPITVNTNTFGVVYTGKQYIVEGKGLPILNSSKYGNMIIEFNVEYPKIKNHNKVKELKKLLEEVFYV